MFTLPEIRALRVPGALAVIVSAVAFGLSACTVGPNYVKPETEIEMPDEWERSVTEEMSTDTLNLNCGGRG